MFIFLVGCESAPTLSGLDQPEIDVAPINLAPLVVVDANVIEPILAEREFEISEVPFNDFHYTCGWEPYDEQDEIRRILEEADTILKLTNVYEEWIPINGKPRKYYVLKIE
jgi:hypothetical protein